MDTNKIMEQLLGGGGKVTIWRIIEPGVISSLSLYLYIKKCQTKDCVSS